MKTATLVLLALAAVVAAGSAPATLRGADARWLSTSGTSSGGGGGGSGSTPTSGGGGGSTPTSGGGTTTEPSASPKPPPTTSTSTGGGGGTPTTSTGGGTTTQPSSAPPAPADDGGSTTSTAHSPAPPAPSAGPAPPADDSSTEPSAAPPAPSSVPDPTTEPNDDAYGPKPSSNPGPNPNCQSAISLIEAAEGYRDCTYVDTTGHKTICYGFNLDTGSAQGAIEGVGGNWNTVYNHCGCGTSGAGCLSQGQCQELLQGAVSTAEQGAASVFGEQCSCIQAVLTDMTYNLGEGGISGFSTFISYITSHQWAKAANDLYGTLWCKQVGSRCSRDANIISGGC